MIEINPNIIAIALRNQWHSETLEHYQEDEYYSLDFTNETDIRYAINKWLSIGWHNEIEKNIYK